MCATPFVMPGPERRSTSERPARRAGSAAWSAVSLPFHVAVDGDDLPGDARGFGAHEEQGHLRDVVRPHPRAHRDEAEAVVTSLLEGDPHPLGARAQQDIAALIVDRARQDGVTAYSFRAELPCREIVISCRAALEVTYGNLSGSPCFTDVVMMLTMLGVLLWRRCGRAARTTKNAPSRLTAWTSRHSWSVKSAAPLRGPPTPALFITTSRPPISLAASAIAASTAAESATFTLYLRSG